MLIISFYILLSLANLLYGLKEKKNWVLYFLSMGLLLYLMCNLFKNPTIDEYDLSNYLYRYETSNVYDSDKLYYIFFYFIELAKITGISFIQWWSGMTILSFSVITIAIKKLKINPHLFLFYFMVYYVFFFYTGLKLYYGFPFLLLGFGYLLQNSKLGNIAFVLFTVIAGGFHPMYYFYLLLIAIPFLSEHRKILYVISVAAILFTLFAKLNGGIQRILLPLFAGLDTEDSKISSYFELETNLGFLIPISLHLVSLFVTYSYKEVTKFYKKAAQFTSKPKGILEYYQKVGGHGNILHYSNMIQMILYPFFLVAIVFMRVFTTFSFVIILVMLSNREYMKDSHRKIIIWFSLLILLVYYMRGLVLGYFYNSSIVPFFSST